VPTRPKKTKAPPIMAEADIAIVRIAPETSFKNKAYEALKEAILKMDIYATPEQIMLDERALSGTPLGVSRTLFAKRSRCWSRMVSSRPCRAAASSWCAGPIPKSST